MHIIRRIGLRKTVRRYSTRMTLRLRPFMRLDSDLFSEAILVFIAIKHLDLGTRMKAVEYIEDPDALSYVAIYSS